MIEKRGPNTYRIGFQVDMPDGSRVWIRETFHATPGLTEKKQRREAEEALLDLRVRHRTGEVTAIPRQVTVRDFASMWIEQHVRPNCKPTTLKNYQNFLDVRILPMLGDVPLSDLTPIMLTRWINEVRASSRQTTRLPDDQLKNRRRPSVQAKVETHATAQALSARTVQHYYTTLSTMLDMAVTWGYIQNNPMLKVARPKAKKTKVSCLSEERAIELLRCLSQEPNMGFRSAVLLALLCGLRLGEVGALKLSDVNWTDGTIDISRAVNYTREMGNYHDDPKTDAGIRPIDLPSGMMTILHETRAYQEECAALAGDVWIGTGLIVHRWDGGPVHHDTPSKWFRKFADAHGFEGVTFHQLRHTHASILLANNVDVVAVARRMGHDDPSTTLRIYAHALRRRDRDSANIGQALLERAKYLPDQDAED